MHKFGTNEGRKLAGQLAIQVYLENGHLNLCVCECVCMHCISDCRNIRVLYCTDELHCV